MSEFLKIILTASATLLGGLSLLVLKQMFIEPIYDLRKLIGEISYHVFLSREVIENTAIPSEPELEKITDKFKNLSASIRAAINVVPLFSTMCFLRIVPQKDKLLEAASSLSTLSYCKYQQDKALVAKEVDKLFNTLGLTVYSEIK